MMTARVMPDMVPPRIDGEQAEQLALELAVHEARTDPRPSVPHDMLRQQFLRDVGVARARLVDLAAKGRSEGWVAGGR